ncbi:MAG: DNA/RNA helicase domain-containing protein, partial [bacterium]
HELINLLEKQEIWDIEDINTLFSPALFLVSPFTSPLKFLTNEYFLTDQQRMIKKEIIDAITNNQAIDLFSISGDYGTGKTLLIYDIAKSLKEYYDVVILHTMEEELVELSYLRSQGYNIKPLSCFHEVVKDADVIIIDEAQSLSQETFDMLLADQESCRIILSYDPYAFLIMSHALHHMKEQLKNHPNSRMFSLTHKIRTNKEMASFINHLFDLRKTENFMQYDHITCQYFSERADSAEFITRHQKAGFVLLEEGVVSSDLIMREYDQVMVIIDERFSYDEVGRLCADEESLMMLYQAITRVKKQLILIIINNEHLLKECVLLKMGSLESTYRRNK